MIKTLSPPDPSFRWVLVSAAALLLGIAMGMMVNGMSAFLVPVSYTHLTLPTTPYV